MVKSPLPVLANDTISSGALGQWWSEESDGRIDRAIVEIHPRPPGHNSQTQRIAFQNLLSICRPPSESHPTILANEHCGCLFQNRRCSRLRPQHDRSAADMPSLSSPLKTDVTRQGLSKQSRLSLYNQQSCLCQACPTQALGLTNRCDHTTHRHGPDRS